MTFAELIEIFELAMPKARLCHVSRFGTRYYRWGSIVIRVGNHQQVAGGGAIANTGERRGPADLDLWVGRRNYTEKWIQEAAKRTNQQKKGQT